MSANKNANVTNGTKMNPMSKRVTITLELSESFIRLLQAKCQLSEWTRWEENGRQIDTGAVLCLVVLGEARGATEEQIWAKTPMEWRPHIAAIHEERKVLEVSDG